jgi:hypothetical protein
MVEAARIASLVWTKKTGVGQEQLLGRFLVQTLSFASSQQ